MEHFQIPRAKKPEYQKFVDGEYLVKRTSLIRESISESWKVFTKYPALIAIVPFSIVICCMLEDVDQIANDPHSGL